MQEMQQPKRHRFSWSMAEVNRLHNEYEIKELNVQQIATLHSRSIYAILYKLSDEKLIDEKWQNVRGFSFFPVENTFNSINLKSIDYECSVSDSEDDEETQNNYSEDEEYYLEEDDDEDDDYESDEDIDDENVNDKISFLQKQINSIKSFLYSNFHSKPITEKNNLIFEASL